MPAPPTVREQAEVIGEHYRLAEVVYGERCGRQMRKFGIKYSALHPRGSDVRQAFVQVSRYDELQAAIRKWYTSDEPGCYPPPELHCGVTEC